MNKEHLSKLIKRYTDRYEEINNAANNEIFKWKAVKHFRDVWFSEASSELTFAERFKQACKGCSVLIDNAYVSPTNGIVKMAEEFPAEMEHLFYDVLLADDGGDIEVRQNNMDRFLDEFDQLRVKRFPRYFKYKQDRHAASCYLAFMRPEEDYIYRYSDAEAFAVNVEFGLDIGSGENFSLANYYALCDVVVEALRENSDLMGKYHALLNDSHYHDESLHLMAFDLMYCCRCYHLYDGIEHRSKKDSVKEYHMALQHEKEVVERAENLAQLRAEAAELERRKTTYESISLLNVTVHTKQEGEGVVIAQNVNQITVRFAAREVSFEISKKYIFRPRFEDDAQIVAAFEDYAVIKDRLKKLETEIKKLED